MVLDELDFLYLTQDAMLLDDVAGQEADCNEAGLRSCGVYGGGGFEVVDMLDAGGGRGVDVLDSPDGLCGELVEWLLLLLLAGLVGCGCWEGLGGGGLGGRGCFEGRRLAGSGEFGRGDGWRSGCDSWRREDVD